MATNKCPRCNSPCIIKIVAESSQEWCEVDVCKMCGSMYPRTKKGKTAKVKKAAPKKAKKAVKKSPKSSVKKAPKKKPAKRKKSR